MPDAAPRNHFPVPHAAVKGDAPQIDHGRLDPQRSTGALTLRLEVLAPLHAGTGEFEPVGTRLVRVAMSRGGRPVVPGSTIKGACRQTYEALTDSDSPFPSDRLASRGGSSASAALFGSLGYQGRVGFDDAELTEPVRLVEVLLSQTYPPRDKTGRRFYGLLPAGAAQERLIPAWAIPAGSFLRTQLRVRNVDEREIGGVLLSLGVGRFVLRLGGGRYDGYGCVRVALDRYALRSGTTWRRPEWIGEPAAVNSFRDRCLAAFEPTPAGKAALALLCEKLVAPPLSPGGAEAPR